jgi:hypothetical protein
MEIANPDEIRIAEPIEDPFKTTPVEAPEKAPVETDVPELVPA